MKRRPSRRRGSAGCGGIEQLRRGVAAALVSVAWTAAAFAGDEEHAAENLGYRHPGLAAAANPAGEILLVDLGCVACHAPPESLTRLVPPKEAPRLDEVGGRCTPGFLRAFIADPSRVRPGTAMPNLVASLPEAERAEAVEDLVHFLVSLGGPLKPSEIESDPYEIERGEKLFHTAGCVACHEPQAPPPAPAAGTAPEPGSAEAYLAELRKLRAAEKPPRPSVPIDGLARKTTAGELQVFLLDPLSVRPSGRMPAVPLTLSEARAVAMYLLREQAHGEDRGPEVELAGIRFAYFEERFENAALETFAKYEPKATGVSPGFDIGRRSRNDYFGFLFRGMIRIERPGTYTFFTRSDDGSRLYIDRKLVVNNDGIHGSTERSGRIELEPGFHEIAVTMFEHAGGEDLSVSYAGPDIGKRVIPPGVLFHRGRTMKPVGYEPLDPDPERVERGRARFLALGCASCHRLTEGGERLPSPVRAKPLAALDPAAEGGCLSADPAPGRPRFDLHPETRKTLKETLERKTFARADVDLAGRVRRALQAFNCLACHSRDGEGGVDPHRYDYFLPSVEADLGDEGRIPPPLDGVGAKLRPEWLKRVLVARGTARPYMATRMPQFGEANVGWLAGTFAALDDPEPAPEEPPSADRKLAEAGRLLVGTRGMSCITCHVYGSHPSLGIPALDLTAMPKRLKRAWFRAYLLDPQRFRPGTRMPQFWPQGESVRPEILEGDTERQIDAIWAYLARGESARLPHGLRTEGMPLIPEDEPIVYRNFIAGAGPSGIAVGFPEEVHYAFDPVVLRVAMIWRGGFLEVSRHRTGRGAGFVPPLGKEVVHFPQGPDVAFLASPEAPWPGGPKRLPGYRMRGYRLDKARRPAILYRVGSVDVEDRLVPIEGLFAEGFRRRLRFHSPERVAGLWFRALRAPHIEQAGGRVFRTDTGLEIRLAPSVPEPRLRKAEGETELLVPCVLEAREDGFGTVIEEEIRW